MMPEAGEARGIWLTSAPMALERKLRLSLTGTAPPGGAGCKGDAGDKPEGICATLTKQARFEEGDDVPAPQLIWAGALSASIMSIKRARTFLNKIPAGEEVAKDN